MPSTTTRHLLLPSVGLRAAAPARPLGLPLLLLAAVLGLAACGDAAQAPAAAGGGAPPPPQVGVVTVAPQTVALQTELPGRVEPLRTAQVRARVNGVVLKRHFTEGSEVRAGQALFQIDPAPYQAAVDSAAAQLARAEAGLAQASATRDRYAPLAAAQAISAQLLQDTEAAVLVARAEVAVARAALRTARINLGYASVQAPIAGRIGRALVTEGALVSAAEATPLALVQQTSRVYVNFTQSSAELLALRRALGAGQLQRANAAKTANATETAAVQVLLDDGSVLPQPGRLLFSDLSVDASTGQVTLRAEVPNPDGLLLPGQYVRVRLAQAELQGGFLVPQQAVTRSPQGDTVLVVGEGNKPGPRPVRVRSSQGSSWVITEGLKAGDQVIVDGFQKMFVPGAPVTPVPWQAPGAGRPAASAPAAK